MRELRTEFEIDAPPEQVWQVLTDFGAYPEWNPFIRSIEGEPQVGSRLKVRIKPPGGRAMTFRPTVQAAEPARELRWLGRLFGPVAGHDGEAAALAMQAELARRQSQYAEVHVPGSARRLVETALASGLRATRPPGLLLLSEGCEPPEALAISGYWLF